MAEPVKPQAEKLGAQIAHFVAEAQSTYPDERPPNGLQFGALVWLRRVVAQATREHREPAASGVQRRPAPTDEHGEAPGGHTRVGNAHGRPQHSWNAM